MSFRDYFEDFANVPAPSPEPRRPGIFSRMLSAIAWKLWGRRRYIREQQRIWDEKFAQLQRNAYEQVMSPRYIRGTDESKAELTQPISYQDMHIEHYEKQRESLPAPVMPPPDYDDDGLN